MIIEKSKVVLSYEKADEVDAPPAYNDDVLFSPSSPLSPSSSIVHSDSKRQIAGSAPVSPQDLLSPNPVSPSPYRSTSSRNLREVSRSSTPAGKGKSTSSWFKSKDSANDTQEEIKAVIFGLVKDLCRVDYSSPPTPRSVLDGCREASSSYGMTFSELMQSKQYEGHTPLYWAILNRPAGSQPADDEIINEFLHFSAPLTPSTISDIRLACLQRADEPLFQRLRHSPDFTARSGTDDMLLGTTVRPDQITVKTSPDDEVSFMTQLEIHHFQKRMRVSKEVSVEFIARSRLWSLNFATLPDKNKLHTPRWSVSLALLEESPPTFVQCNLIIEDASLQKSVASPGRPEPSAMASFFNLHKQQLRPPLLIDISLRNMKELIPRGARHRNGQTYEIGAVLDEVLVASSLLSENSYISSDTLVARLEVRLEKPTAEGCIIC
ncbi:hypothetical protein C8J56DRAFT_1041590 [Mycena floridula]|nr:hypothetical protein C8J56DRAFT_1041590 [Mycena floridula]